MQCCTACTGFSCLRPGAVVCVECTGDQVQLWELQVLVIKQRKCVCVCVCVA